MVVLSPSRLLLIPFLNLLADQLMKNIIFINSHPIQYFAPLYKYMNHHGVKTKAWYCTDQSVRGGLDAEFGVHLKWDIPLLNGYEYQFFKNQSWKPSYFNGFFGLINLGMVWNLFRIPKSVIVVHGYHYCTHFLILLLSRLRGHTLCLRLETPLMHEEVKKGWKTFIRKKVLKYFVFSQVNYFLYIGTQNQLFYKSLDVPDNKLIFCPYAVDNARFKEEKEQLCSSVLKIKSRIGIPPDHKIVLYSGKYIEKKNPIDVLKAFHRLNIPDCWLIMLGEGELRTELEKLIVNFSLNQVLLTGFVNQSKVSEYYAISDVLVMSSSFGETWGLSVNEALNFDLPIIVSNLTGCSQDLVKDGDNGYIYETGNVDELTLKLKQVLVEKKLTHKTSLSYMLNKYSYASITGSLRSLVN